MKHNENEIVENEKIAGKLVKVKDRCDIVRWTKDLEEVIELWIWIHPGDVVMTTGRELRWSDSKHTEVEIMHDGTVGFVYKNTLIL